MLKRRREALRPGRSSRPTAKVPATAAPNSARGRVVFHGIRTGQDLVGNQARISAHLGFDLAGDIGVDQHELARILAALPDPLRIIGVPGPGLLDHLALDAKIETDGGDVITNQIGPAIQVRVLSIPRMTTAEKDSLRSFIVNTIEYSIYTFDFTDADSTVFSDCTLWDDAFEPVEDHEGSWAAVISFRT